jgi:hypothetical protein
MATYQGLAGTTARGTTSVPRWRGDPALHRGLRAAPGRAAEAEDRWAELAMKIMAEHLKLERTYYEDGDDMLDLNNIASTFQTIRQVLDLMDTSTAEGWTNLITRVETIGTRSGGYQKTLEKGLAREWSPRSARSRR